jgi:hypothetical protein
MPRIPINPQDLPSASDRFEPLDESLTYEATVEMLGEGVDKNNHNYITARHKITAPEEFTGRVVYDNYIALPWKPTSDMDAKARKNAETSGDRLGDLARSAGIMGGDKGWDTDELLGCTVRFTVQNEEYNGQIRSRPRSYLSDKAPF